MNRKPCAGALGTPLTSAAHSFSIRKWLDMALALSSSLVLLQSLIYFLEALEQVQTLIPKGKCLAISSVVYNEVRGACTHAATAITSWLSLGRTPEPRDFEGCSALAPGWLLGAPDLCVCPCGRCGVGWVLAGGPLPTSAQGDESWQRRSFSVPLDADVTFSNGPCSHSSLTTPKSTARTIRQS